ncbi:hypothetical protein [Streptomyces sp. Tu 4128]|nr:hypothetical protein [Streptomyces sp. Tu 4128]
MGLTPRACERWPSAEPPITGIEANKSVAARKELGLATTISADEAEVWAD